jgi:hypothetical protein
MKKFFTALRVLLCVWCFGLASAAYAGNVWGALSQADRNARIVAQARYAADRTLLAGQCKSFAVDVVRVASNQANGYVWNGVTTPPGDGYTRTLPDTAGLVSLGDMLNYYWIPYPTDLRSLYVDSTAGYDINPLFGVVPGNIIQMRIRLKNNAGFTPHTSIVEKNNKDTQVLTLIDSNMDNDGLVKRRWINYPDFVKQLEEKYTYTIYQIR